MKRIQTDRHVFSAENQADNKHDNIDGYYSIQRNGWGQEGIDGFIGSHYSPSSNRVSCVKLIWLLLVPALFSPGLHGIQIDCF